MTLNSSLSCVGRYGWLYTLPAYNFVIIISFEDRIVLISFVGSFYIKKHFNRRKNTFWVYFFSLAITGIDVNDIIRYPSRSLKYHLTSILTVF